MNTYIIPILNIDLYKILEKKVVDPSNKDKYHIRGKFIHIFDKYIIEKEKIQVELKQTNAVIYTTTERSTTPFMRVNANCKICSNTCKYTITIDKDPFKNSQTNRDYSDVSITVSGPHTHNNTIKLNGENRAKTAEEITNKFHGSSKKYFLDKKAKGFNPPNELALRKCHSEHNQQKV